MNKPAQLELDGVVEVELPSLSDAMCMSEAAPFQVETAVRNIPHVDDGEFDWSPSGKDANSIVIHEQSAIAVYANVNGDTVVSEKARNYPDEDRFIVIRPDNVQALSEALAARVRRSK